MASKKDFTVSVPADKVMYTNISKSKDGYNSARLVAKIGDNEYMAISYEWEGDGVPAFAMNLMGFMKANEVETSGVWPEYAAEVCSECGKPKSKCTCEEDAACGGGGGSKKPKKKMKK